MAVPQKHAWSFFISMSDFSKLFSCVYVCNVLPSNWHTNLLHCAWDDGTDEPPTAATAAAKAAAASNAADDGVADGSLDPAAALSRSSSGTFLPSMFGGGRRVATAGGCSKNKATYRHNPQFVLSAPSSSSSYSSSSSSSGGSSSAGGGGHGGREEEEEAISVQLVLSQADPRRSHLRPCVLLNCLSACLSFCLSVCVCTYYLLPAGTTSTLVRFVMAALVSIAP